MRKPCVAIALAALLFNHAASAAPTTGPKLSDESAPPAAAPSSRLWREEWPQFSWTEGLLTAASGSITAALLVHGPVDEPRWRGPVLFDGELRSSVRADDAESRSHFRSVGDATYYAAPALALVDALVLPLVHGDGKAARNLSLVTIEAFSYSGLASIVATSSFARARPDSEDCRRDAGCNPDTQSFFSGHSAIAATTAGLVCANHRYLPLGGHPVVDIAACALASANALVTGATRVVADRHYGTDVTVGLGLGFAIGYAVPVLLHFERSRPRPAVEVTANADRVLVTVAWRL